MRTVDKGLFQGNQESYLTYGDAKDDLIAALGCFCSYCERQGFRSALAVEHIQHKDNFPALAFSWSNLMYKMNSFMRFQGHRKNFFNRYSINE